MYIIHSYEGFDDILFGMTSEEIQRKIKRNPRKFYKFHDDKYETDDYADFFVYYKEPGICEAVEFHKEASVSYQGVPLFQKTYQELEAWLGEMDADLRDYDEGFISLKLGIGVYAPDKEEEVLRCPVEAIIIFEKGLYDGLL